MGTAVARRGGDGPRAANGDNLLLVEILPRLLPHPPSLPLPPPPPIRSGFHRITPDKERYFDRSFVCARTRTRTVLESKSHPSSVDSENQNTFRAPFYFVRNRRRT